MASLADDLRGRVIADGADLRLVVRGCDGDQILSAVESVLAGRDEEDELLPSHVSQSAMLSGEVSLVVDLKGVGELNAEFVRLLAAALPEDVEVLGAVRSSSTGVEQQRPALTFYVYSPDAGLPWRRGGHRVPSTWLSTLVDALAAMPEVDSLGVSTVPGGPRERASAPDALEWLSADHQPSREVVGMRADDTCCSVSLSGPVAVLGIHRPSGLAEANELCRAVIDRLEPAPLSAVSLPRWSSEDFDTEPFDSRAGSNWSPTNSGPELVDRFAALGPLQLLPDGVHDAPSFRAALERSAMVHRWEGRWLWLGAPDDWSSAYVRARYLHLACTDLTQWRAVERTRSHQRDTRLHFRTPEGEAFTVTAPGTLPAIALQWFRASERLDIVESNPALGHELLERFADQLIDRAEVDPDSRTQLLQQTELVEYRLPESSHLSLSTNYWYADRIAAWNRSLPHAEGLLDLWAAEIADLIRRHRRTIGPTIWDPVTHSPGAQPIDGTTSAP